MVTPGHNQTYSYDLLNRLSTASEADGAFNQTFSYDPWGNMSYSGGTGGSTSYSLQNRVAAYCHDQSGNILDYGACPATGPHQFAWNGAGRLSAVTAPNPASYTYDGDGNRVRKDAGSSWTEYVHFNEEPIAENSATGWTDYIFAGSKRIAEISAGNTQYYWADHLQSARVMLDSSGNAQCYDTYTPFGSEVGTCAMTHYKFTGKERDTESNLDYFGARYYSSTMGRWMSPDWADKPEPVPYADLSDPQSLNLYGYVRNNPMSHADADGHCCDLSDIADFIAGASNAYGSDNLAGAGRMDQSTPAGRIGGAFGDAAATIQGTGEALIGGGGEALGVALDATGAGAVLGIPVGAVSTGMIIHGTATGITGGASLIKDANVTAGTKPYKGTPANQERMEEGKAPVGNDGNPVELHHDGQTTNSPTKEMTRTDHRLGANYKKNHANTGQRPSQIDRNQAAKQRREHWKNQANDNQ